MQDTHNRFASVVVLTHTSKHEWRNEISKRSLSSLRETVLPPHELIVFENPNNSLSLGEGRNRAIQNAHGYYLVVSDDDILFSPGWLEECIKMVEMGEHFIATPVHQPRIKKWELEKFGGYRNNGRTGSNCMVMRMSDFEKIGPFEEYLGVDNCGKRYANKTTLSGYSFLITKEPMAQDLAFKRHSYL